MVWLLFAEQDNSFAFDGSNNIRYFSTETADALWEFFVGLPVIGI